MKTLREFVNSDKLPKAKDNKDGTFSFGRGEKYIVTDYYEGTKNITKGVDLVAKYVKRYNTYDSFKRYEELQYDIKQNNVMTERDFKIQSKR